MTTTTLITIRTAAAGPHRNAAWLPDRPDVWSYGWTPVTARLRTRMKLARYVASETAADAAAAEVAKLKKEIGDAYLANRRVPAVIAQKEALDLRTHYGRQAPRDHYGRCAHSESEIRIMTWTGEWRHVNGCDCPVRPADPVRSSAR